MATNAHDFCIDIGCFTEALERVHFQLHDRRADLSSVELLWWVLHTRNFNDEPCLADRVLELGLFVLAPECAFFHQPPIVDGGIDNIYYLAAAFIDFTLRVFGTLNLALKAAAAFIGIDREQ